MPEKPLTPTQQAMYEKVKLRGEILWAGTSSAETRTLNALVDKGLIIKTHNARFSTVYKVAGDH